MEETEVIGPSVLELYASTTHNDILWFVSLNVVQQDGKERMLIKGWLRGSQNAIDSQKSKPWAPKHPHDHRELLNPNEIYKFIIPILPTGYVFKMGTRLRLRISCCDEPAKNSMEGTTVGHIRRPYAARVTVYHNEDYPSRLLLPITEGNLIGTYGVSGGHPYLNE